MDYINELHELCETISREIAEANEKIRSSGGKLTGGDYETIDKLTHSLKSIKAVIAMMEDEGGSYADGGSYEGSYDGGNMGGSYRYSREGGSYRGGSYNGNGGSYRGSYARGRGSNARRDSMGRYSSRGYSRAGDLVDQLHELMQDAPNENIKREMQKLAEKIEQQM